MPDSGDVYGFRAARREYDAQQQAGAVAAPKGWRPIYTYTKDPRDIRVRRDPWDDRPSRNPYPPGMPSLDTAAQTGPGAIDVHVRMLRQLDRVVHEGLVLYAAGSRDRLRELRAAITRRHAIRQELGTGVVVLTDAELAVLNDNRDTEGVA